MRDYSLEKRLQEALDNGRNVWVIGDVHGFSQTLEELLESLKLEPDDFVVLLGDLIDRGPNSARVVEIVKNECNIFSLKGNHESMMVEAIDSKGTNLVPKKTPAKIWASSGSSMVQFMEIYSANCQIGLYYTSRNTSKSSFYGCYPNELEKKWTNVPFSDSVCIHLIFQFMHNHGTGMVESWLQPNIGGITHYHHTSVALAELKF